MRKLNISISICLSTVSGRSEYTPHIFENILLYLYNKCGASSNGRWMSARFPTSTSSVMSSWRSRRGLLWQPVKLWWTQCPRGLRKCWKIMVATQHIDILGPIWTFSLRVVLTFVASGLDINGCVLSYFERTALLYNLYTHYFTL